LLITNQRVFSVKGAEKVPCPCCGGELKVIGSRLRKYIEDSGTCVSLRIRRLCCGTCSKVHHELPDLLIPYKRYESRCFEKVVSQPHKNDVAADNSTLYRWNRWFLESIDYWLACLHSIILRFQQINLAPVDPSSVESLTALEKIGRLFGDAPGWLARMARPIVNVHLWVQTRSAFLSG